jgi:putative transposase
MKSVADVIGVARSNLAERAKQRERKAIGRPPQPDADLIAEIKAVKREASWRSMSASEAA